MAYFNCIGREPGVWSGVFLYEPRRGAVMFATKRRLTEALVSCGRRLTPGLRLGLEMTPPLRGSISLSRSPRYGKADSDPPPTQNCPQRGRQNLGTSARACIGENATNTEPHSGDRYVAPTELTRQPSRSYYTP